MPNTNFGDINKLYREFMQTHFGDMPLESAYDKEVFAEQQRMLELRRKKMTSRVMERLAAQGIMTSGVGSEMLTEQVETPIAHAEAALGEERAERIRAEKTRRGDIGREFAMGEFERRKAREAEKSGFWGKLAGGVIKGGITGFMAGGPYGALAGAGLGAFGAAYSGGGEEEPGYGGHSYQWLVQQKLQQLEEEWQRTHGGGPI